MPQTLNLSFTPPIEVTEAFLEPHREWIESMTGCPRSETVIHEAANRLGEVFTTNT